MFDNYGEFISISQFGKIMGVSRNRAYEIVREDHIPIFKTPNTRARIHKNDLIEYITKNTSKKHNVIQPFIFVNQ